MTKEALRHLSKSDRTLAKLISRVGPCTLRVNDRRTPLHALVRAVTHQQLHGQAAERIFRRFRALYPGRSFPAPEAILATPDEKLRSAGLSRAKTAAIKDIAAKTIEGVVPGSREMTKLSEAEILERLITVRGVGPWTVDMLLIFTLGRQDVLPVTDYGVRKGFAVVYGRNELPQPVELREFGER
jgi:DNA-3-methyladenine glycosylase II